MSRCLFFAMILALSCFAGAQSVNEADLESLMERAGAMKSGDPAQMQLLIDQLGPLQACLAGLDDAALATLQRESERRRQEVTGLGASGAYDEAQEMAERYGQQIAESDVLKQVLGCTDGMTGLLPSMAALTQSMPRLEGQRVCDAPRLP